MKNNKSDSFEWDGVERRKRHSITVDAVSLLDEDSPINGIEEEAFAQYSLVSMLSELYGLSTKLVLLCLWIGFKKNEIASIMGVHPSTVTRIHQRIIDLLEEKYNQPDINTPDGAQIHFLYQILGINARKLTK